MADPNSPPAGRQEKSQGMDKKQALQRDTLSAQVLDTLMDQIMDGTLDMGDRLNTSLLARQLGVSRMPVRDALCRLEQMGLAESVPYEGMRLVTLSEDDVLQLYLMRQKLEPLVADKACMYAGADDIAHLEAIHSEYVQIITAQEINAKELYLKNRQFHMTIYALSRMDRVCGLIEDIWNTLSFFKLIYGREILKGPDGVADMIDEHRSYIDALKSRDGSALQNIIYDTLAKRIEGLAGESDYYGRRS